MRIVVTSDTHKPVDPAVMPIPDGDVFIHAGDFCQTGYPSDFEKNLDWLAALPHKIKLLVPGNHDFHLQVYRGPGLQALRSIGFTVLGMPNNPRFNTYQLPNGMTVLGCPLVLNLPGWAFNAPSNDAIYDYMRSNGRHDIVVTHAPVEGVNAGKNEAHWGIRAYEAYLRQYNPRYWFHGHVHEMYGHTKFRDTDVYNVAMCDRTQTHVNPPIVLDL